MPDTQPITKSFPWLLVGHHRPVFDNINRTSTSVVFYITETGDFYVTENGVDNYITESATQLGPGDLYRYI